MSDTKFMTKQCAFWRPVACRNVRGGLFIAEWPEIIANSYSGRLLEEILRMPKQTSISFDDAIRIANDEFARLLDAKRSYWIQTNFVEYISNKGFHIELSGDEFTIALKQFEAC